MGAVILAAGCREPIASSKEAAVLQPAPEVMRSGGELVAAAAAALKVSGIPEPPLAAESTRQQRQEYLVATEEALSTLRKLPAAGPDAPAVGDTLIPHDRTSEVLALGKLLAVELADAIDRSDAKRTEDALRLAFIYSDSLYKDSIAAACAGASVADSLVLGLKSVAGQLDSPLTTKLIETLDSIERHPPQPSAAIAESQNRIARWLKKVKAINESPKVADLLFVAGADQHMRLTSTPEFQKALKGLEVDGRIPADVLAKESELVVERVAEYLHAAGSGERPTLNSPELSAHAIAALYISVVRPSIEAAPRLGQMRLENIRILRLAIRILSADSPDDLSSFGEDAVSPVNQMKFRYTKTKGGFELERPRLPAK